MGPTVIISLECLATIYVDESSRRKFDDIPVEVFRRTAMCNIVDDLMWKGAPLAIVGSGTPSFVKWAAESIGFQSSERLRILSVSDPAMEGLRQTPARILLGAADFPRSDAMERFNQSEAGRILSSLGIHRSGYICVGASDPLVDVDADIESRRFRMGIDRLADVIGFRPSVRATRDWAGPTPQADKQPTLETSR